MELRAGDMRTERVDGATRVLLFATCLPRSLTVGLQRRLAAALPLGARVFAVSARGWRPRLSAEGAAGGRRWLAREADSATPAAGDVASMVWTVTSDDA